MSTELQAQSVASVAAVAPSDIARRRAIVAMVTVLATFLAFWPTTTSLMEQWEDTLARTYTHGYVVVVIALWLIWRDRAQWAGGSVQAHAPAFGILVAGSLSWLLAYRAGLQIVHQAALPLLTAAAILTMFGWRALRGLAFPLAWLFLAIPVWDTVRPILNWLSVMVERVLLRTFDIPAFFESNRIQLPAGTFEIADGCSGLHFWVVALTISLLYGEINRDSLRVRVKLVALALLLAMLTNWVRIFIIVLLGYQTDMQHTLVANEHYSFGWYMFAGTMVIYFLIVRRWPAMPTPIRDASVPVGEPVPRAGLLMALLGVAVVPAWLQLDQNRANNEQLKIGMRSDVPIQPPSEPFVDWQPRFPGATREIQGVLQAADGAIVQVYVAGYAVQKQDAEVVGYHTSLTGDQLRRGPGGARAPIPWTETVALGTGGRSIIWHAYRLDDDWHASPFRMQLAYGFHSFMGNPASAIVALRARCNGDDCNAARRSLQSFVETHYP